jgi:hypothetical protein
MLERLWPDDYGRRGSCGAESRLAGRGSLAACFCPESCRAISSPAAPPMTLERPTPQCSPR